MAEDPQPQSISQRIAALNATHVGRIPGELPQPRPKPTLLSTRPVLTERYKTINNPPARANGSLNGFRIGNQPNAQKQNNILPPPTLTTTARNEKEKPRGPPPPLPSRRPSGQPSPALPSRRPSEKTERRGSIESISSTASALSGISIGTTQSDSSRRKSADTGKSVKAPAWGDTELPALPTRPPDAPGRNRSQERPKYAVRNTSSKNIIPPVPTVPLITTQEQEVIPRPSLPPRLPPRRKSTQALDESSFEEPKKSSLKRGELPPIVSTEQLAKVKRSALSFGLNKNSTAVSQEAEPSSTPDAQGAPTAAPPVPLASRPDLSRIQATKPKSGPSSENALATACMTCRDFSGPDHQAALFPRQGVRSLPELAQGLTAPFSSRTDKARAIFSWLHHNIQYDVDSFFNKSIQPSTPQSTLSSGLAVCEGYAALFHNLASHAGLESLSIHGHGKGYGYHPLVPGSSTPPFDANHAWNAVKIDGDQWKLIDCCWGAGHVQGAGRPYAQHFHPECFTMSNEEFGTKHFPSDNAHLFGPAMDWEEFIHLNPDTWWSNGIETATVFSNARENYGIGSRTLQPIGKEISIRQQGLTRFQFELVCEHWTLEKHVKRGPPPVFVLAIHGLDGRKDDFVPFDHRSSGGRGGDIWYTDVQISELGAPGQTITLFAVTRFGNRGDTRGLSVQEFKAGKGRTAMGFQGVAAWELV
ncbi:MAG: hypothetical protein Q9160_002268 [Pyrenula sp. 1 TL-2023]